MKKVINKLAIRREIKRLNRLLWAARGKKLRRYFKKNDALEFGNPDADTILAQIADLKKQL